MLRSKFITRTVPFLAIRRRRDYLLKPGIVIGAIHVLAYCMELLIVGPDRMYPSATRFLLLTLVTTPFVGMAFAMITHMDQLRLSLGKLAMTDMLTNLLNRRAFMEQAENSPAGYLLVIDADNFKVINDTYGHATGDLCLMAIANHLRSSMRADDVIGRIGGEEFAVFLPFLPQDEIGALGMRLAGPISITIDHHPEPIIFTLSIGAARRRTNDKICDVFHLADAALYRAKANGRAQLVIWDSRLKSQAA